MGVFVSAGVNLKLWRKTWNIVIFVIDCIILHLLLMKCVHNFYVEKEDEKEIRVKYYFRP